MLTLHRLKFAGKKMCDAVYSGRKRFEIRYNYRDFKKGDIIFPVPIKDNGELLEHPLVESVYVIDFVLKDYPGIQPGYCILSIREVKETDIPKCCNFDKAFDEERFYTYGTNTILGRYSSDRRFSNKQLEILRYGVEAGIDTSSYANPYLSVQAMTEKYLTLLPTDSQVMRKSSDTSAGVKWSEEAICTLFRNHSIPTIQTVYSPEEIRNLYIDIFGTKPSYFMNTGDILNCIHEKVLEVSLDK